MGHCVSRASSQGYCSGNTQMVKVLCWASTSSWKFVDSILMHSSPPSQRYPTGQWVKVLCVNVTRSYTLPTTKTRTERAPWGFPWSLRRRQPQSKARPCATALQDGRAARGCHHPSAVRLLPHDGAHSKTL